LKINLKDFSYHPLNLALRFILELGSLLAAGFWGYRWGNGSYLLAIGIPIFMMVVWAVFAVPGDRSRSGNALVPIPGAIRLILELTFFGFGTGAIYDLGLYLVFWIFLSVAIIHHCISYKRMKWLLTN